MTTYEPRTGVGQSQVREQPMLTGMPPELADTRPSRNQILDEDRPVHDWYRFVLSFPPHLVREYMERFNLGENATVLDPFCGTGTTLVEAKKRGIGSVGIEAVPMSAFAAETKLDWLVDPAALEHDVEAIGTSAKERLTED